MGLIVKLQIVERELAEQKKRESHGENRGDIPEGVFIEDKDGSNKRSSVESSQLDSVPEDSGGEPSPEASTEATGEDSRSPEETKRPSMAKMVSASGVSADTNEHYGMTIESSGKFSRKADWSDIASFAKLETVNSDVLKEWLHHYQELNYPEQLQKANCIPRTASIKDEPKKGMDAYKVYGWKPVKLNLQPGLIDVKEQWTKQVVLEQFPVDYTTDIETALQERGDKEVVSTLRRSKVAGHPLAMELLKSRSQVITEFRGIDSVVFTLGNNVEAGKVDEETGDEVWKDVKKLRALLHGKPLPKKTGKGVSRTVDVMAYESCFKARVYYKAFFTGTVTTDHGNEQFDGQRYWNWDLKYFLRYNDIPNAVVVYEDIELHFFTRVHLNMENEDWEWVNKRGSWIKQKLSELSVNDSS